MEEFEGKSGVRKGTPPSPEDPYPSSQTVTELPDGGVRIVTTGPIDEQLAEYEQSVATWPESAELRLQYGFTLGFANRRTEAREQLETAIRLRPEWYMPHMALGAVLHMAGENEAALAVQQEALHLLSQEDSTENRQGIVLIRQGMAKSMRGLGRTAEARHQLEQAITLEQAEVTARAGKHQRLLQQLQEALAQMEEI